jgi:hypothetical protein
MSLITLMSLHFIRFLLAPSALEELVIDWVTPYWPRPPHWKARKFRKALEFQKESLRRLEITDADDEMYDSDTDSEYDPADFLDRREQDTDCEPHPNTLGSLVAYKKLEFLAAPASILFRSHLFMYNYELPRRQLIYKILPRSLKQVRLGHVPIPFLRDVEHMIKNRDLYVPNLRSIQYNGHVKKIDSPAPDSLSVSVTYSYYPPPEPSNSPITPVTPENEPPILAPVGENSASPQDVKTVIPDSAKLFRLYSGSDTYHSRSNRSPPSSPRLYVRLPVPYVLPRGRDGLFTLKKTRSILPTIGLSFLEYVTWIFPVTTTGTSAPCVCLLI